jgi:uncharacterized protein (TIGR03000 family)
MLQKIAQALAPFLVAAGLSASTQTGQAQVRGGGHMAAPGSQQPALFAPFARPATSPTRFYGNYGSGYVPYGGHSNLGYRAPNYATPNNQHNYYGTFPYYDNYYYFYNEPGLSQNAIDDPVYPGFGAGNAAANQGNSDLRDFTRFSLDQPPVVTPEVSSAPLNTAARFTVKLPADAEVWFDGTPLKGTGPEREFRTPALTPGNRYTYEVRARWQENGKEVVQARQVSFAPGDHVQVDFPAPSATLGGDASSLQQHE